VITESDLQRSLTEFYLAYEGPEKWLQDVGIDDNAFYWLIDEFLRAMEKLGDGEVKNSEDAATLFMSTIASAFSFGVEIGRQYPVTPFDE
jgi:hypothetical protein